jgi:hypothetical protein
MTTTTVTWQGANMPRAVWALWLATQLISWQVRVPVLKHI